MRQRRRRKVVDIPAGHRRMDVGEVESASLLLALLLSIALEHSLGRCAGNSPFKIVVGRIGLEPMTR